MILFCTLGAIFLGIILALLILQIVRKNNIRIVIDINDKDDVDT